MTQEEKNMDETINQNIEKAKPKLKLKAKKTGSYDLQTPGQLLSDAREALGISQKEIAEYLNLSVRVVIALEKGDYAAIGAFTFVKGYMRSYARFVKLSPDEIIINFNRLELREERNYEETKKSVIKVPSTSTARSVRWVTYSIVAVLIVLVVLWVRGNGASRQVTSSSVASMAKSAAQPTPSSTNSSDNAAPKEKISLNLTQTLPGSSKKSSSATKSSN